VDGWLAAEQTLASSAISWTEFLNGPVTPLEVSRANAVLQSRIIPFGQKEATLAADLFNKSGRRRGSRFDCLIAATAIIAQAEVATVNQSDFKVFVPHGLKWPSFRLRRPSHPLHLRLHHRPVDQSCRRIGQSAWSSLSSCSRSRIKSPTGSAPGFSQRLPAPISSRPRSPRPGCGIVVKSLVLRNVAV
jgi:predicted nucleic acid-binding protein